MAGQRLTDKTAYTENLASDDKLLIVDTSDTTGSSAGTSKKIDNKFIIQTTKVAVSSGEFQAMDATGGGGTYKDLVAAPGSGYFVSPIVMTAIVDYASGTQSAKLSLYVGYDTSTVSYYWTFVSGFMQGITADRSYAINGYTGTPNADGGAGGLDNRPLRLYASGNFSSTFSADVYVTYQVVKI
tara:strand:+ start:33 stop:584 length:552 start_codon:yes stop_codon:yes gene_type:complete